MIKLFVGLGNPGPEYEDTRHNAGFWWIDGLARELKVQLQPERSYWGMLARANVQGQPVWLLQPQTFMNLSGKSVGALARFFKIKPEEVLVVHDELDFEPGQIKLKKGGSHGGHNGLRDIHAQLGSPEYWRLRVGIGHPGQKSDVSSWVLKKPPQDQWQACWHGHFWWLVIWTKPQRKSIPINLRAPNLRASPHRRLDLLQSHLSIRRNQNK